MKKFILLSLFLLSTRLLISQCYPDRHSTNWFDGWMSCEASVSPNPVNKNGHWLLFDLGQRYRVQKIKIWNYNDPSQLDNGISKLKVEYSGNKVNWYEDRILDLDKAAGHNRYEGMDWMDLGIPEARYILLTAESNFSKSSCFGLGEVLFEVEKLLISDVESEPTNILKAIAQPNPFNQQVYLDLELSNQYPANYQVSDMFGKIWKSSQIESGKGRHTLRILTDEWPVGTYVFSIRQNGESFQTFLVKMK